jgi:hypothetical protein
VAEEPLWSSSLPCIVTTIETSGTVYRTLQPMDTTTSQALSRYPVSLTNVVVGNDFYQIQINKVGPSRFTVITSGPEGKCQLDTNKTADDGLTTTENKYCNQVDTVDGKGYSQLSFKLSTP